MNANTRLILAHKQSTSGRLRFLRLPCGLMAFEALPEDATLVGARLTAVLPHPTAALRDAENRLGLDGGSLCAETEFKAEVGTGSGAIGILLARFTGIDPPFEAALRIGGRFIELTEARDRPRVELELARRAYETLLG